jgi:cytochrome oxidase Cu insertion factor (SCO1/SenC/PrrC family)
MMRSVAIKRMLALTVTGLTLFACAAPERSTRSEGTSTAAEGKGDERSSEPAPDFTVETFGGQPFTLSEQRGTPVVLNFWESW